MVYTYLAGFVGHSKSEGAFRALSRGYTHWASGRLSVLEVNTCHPEFCHVCSTMKPSMKPECYQVYILLARNGGVTSVQSATCECAAGYATLLMIDSMIYHTVFNHFTECVLAALMSQPYYMLLLH